MDEFVGGASSYGKSNVTDEFRVDSLMTLPCYTAGERDRIEASINAISREIESLIDHHGVKTVNSYRS